MTFQKSKLLTTLLTLLTIQFSFAASFDKYFPKLIKFEGNGYGIHQPIWGSKPFTKNQAYLIYKTHYWDKYNASLFKDQGVAEVFIDQLINAGVGKECVHIKAFEAIIGVRQDGYLSLNDIKAANKFKSPEKIINPYINYRLYFYKGRKNASRNKGWLSRAKSFAIRDKAGNMLANYLVLPKMLEKVEIPINNCEFEAEEVVLNN